MGSSSPRIVTASSKHHLSHERESTTQPWDGAVWTEVCQVCGRETRITTGARTPITVDGANAAETRPRFVLCLLEAAGWRVCADGVSMRCPDCLGARPTHDDPPSGIRRTRK